MPSEYTVKKGDTLWNIAKKHNVSLQELIKANPQIKDPKRIFPGNKIIIPDKRLRSKEINKICETCCDETCSDDEKDKKMREELVKGMRELNTAECNGEDRFNYPHNNDGEYRMPPSHWEPKVKNGKDDGQSTRMDFISKPGVKASEAINSLFIGKDCPVVIECLTAMYILYYRAILNTVGSEKFDEMFKRIRIKPREKTIQKYHKFECRDPTTASLKKGDRVYFYNHPDYPERHKKSSNGAFRGENALVVGEDKYEGFGVPACNELEMKQELFDAYNEIPNKYDPTTRSYVYNEEADRMYPELEDDEIDKIPGLIAPKGDCKGKIYPVITPEVSAIPCCLRNN